MIQLNNDLATKALMSIENGGMEMADPSRKRATMSFPSSSTDTQRSAPLKRSRSFSRSALSGSFNMGEFLKASQKVEETIAFPAIEWPSFDDDEDDDSSSDASSLTSPRELRQDVEDDDEDEEEDFFQGRRKRQCRGLTRCSRSCNLSSLCEHSNRSERRGSNGSMS